MPLDRRRVRALFEAALELPDPAERAGFLERACGGDDALRTRVEELLAVYERPASDAESSIVETPADEQGTDADPDPNRTTARPVDALMAVAGNVEETVAYRREGEPAAALEGMVIAGRYTIRREIGEGGMGSVYLADQSQPVKRQVALKLIKAGMDSRMVLARFDSERQALAIMDHPNIAKVLDAGTTENGRPFFVMELVKGTPLTQYCDEHRMGLPERLALFRQICSAVQHAHQKGIIHRDLKPTNILVETHDDQGVPKVIDFGLAKATGGLRLSDHSLHSAFGTVAGTPLYMAPEQATFNAIDIDTRADIYALGVILYELLTGSTPIRQDEFRRAALDEMLRVIREVDPPTPSSRISSSDTLPSVAATRQVEPARLGRFVRGDLDWIVMKALAKERQRRYESPLALAHDIERFLNHEPVSAGPPSATYRLKKFVRRNQLTVSAAAFILLALVVGFVVATVGLVEANRQRRIADGRLVEVRKRLAQRDKANEILLSVFKDLNPRDERQKKKPLDAILGERLDAAAAQLEGEAITDPVGVARMQSALGESQIGLGHYSQARELFAKAHDAYKTHLGADHKDTLATINNVALSYYYGGQYEKALPLLKETLAARRAKSGPDDSDTLEVMGNMGGCYRALGRLDLAIPLFEEVVPMMTVILGRDHPSTLGIMNVLALSYQDTAQYQLAIPLFEETLELRARELGADHPATLTTMNNLAIALQNTGQLNKSLPLFEKTLELTKAKLGPDHPETLNSASNLADAYRAGGNYPKAIALLEDTIPRMKAQLGRDHPETLVAMGNLGRAYRFGGQAERAVALHEESLALMKVKLGPNHPQTLTNTINLGNAYSDAKRYDDALRISQEAFALSKAKLGADHPSTLIVMGNVARGYLNLGKVDQAVSLLEQTVARMKATIGADHPTTLTNVANLADAYRAARKLDRALPLYEQAFTLQRAKLGPNHPATLSSMASLAMAEKESGKLDAAATRMLALAELAKAQGGDESPRRLGAMAALGEIQLLRKAWTDAESILREVLAIREKIEPNAWTTFNARSMLGAALLGQEQYDAAEPLLKSGFQGLKDHATDIPPQGRTFLGQAVDRLIALAEATNKPDDAARWRAEKAKLTAEAPEKK